MVCDYVFDKGICCNGHFGNAGSRDLLNPACGYLDGSSGWTEMDPMPERLCGAASVPMTGPRNMLIVSGGSSKLGEHQFTYMSYFSFT